MNRITFEFPNASDYDLNKPNCEALYNAHIDFFSIRGLIDCTERATIDMINELYMQINMEKDYGDIFSHQIATNNLALYNSRIIPLTYISTLLILISTLEESLNNLCNAYYLANNYSIQFKDLYGQGLERAINYLEKIVGIHNIKKEKQWEFIKIARDARNAIAHNGGRIKDNDITKYEKVGFYVQKENKQILLDYDTLINIYNEILTFINNVFSKTPFKD